MSTGLNHSLVNELGFDVRHFFVPMTKNQDHQMFCDIELREFINIYQKKDSMCHFGPDKDSAFIFYVYIYIYIYIHLALIYCIIFCF